jgi:uncharacterized protein YbjT (DUF2867 family)
LALNHHGWSGAQNRRAGVHIILGGSGHIGSALATALAHNGEPVTIVTRDRSKADSLQQRGIQVAVADVHDSDALRHVFRQGTRLFLLNPPADPSTDTDVEERKSVASILAALDGSGIEKVVAESTYGAQPGERSGDLGVLYEMEQALAAQSIPASIIRGAYYMSNWDAALETARTDGVVQTMFPADFELPMVAPYDIAQVAAGLMIEPVDRTGLYYVEGPERYTPSDVAAAFAASLNRPVELAVTPRDQWTQAFKALGFSEKAADSYAGMTAMTLDRRHPLPDAPVRGSTSLQSYVDALVRDDAS